MHTESARGRLAGWRYPTRMLLVCSLAWATIQCGRYVLPPLIPAIRTNLGLSAAEIGLAFTAFGLCYAGTQYPSGTYSDSLSRATLILPGLVLMVASFLALWLSVTPALFLVALVVLGLCKGLYAPPSRALLADLFTARRGRALGIYSAGTDLGGIAASGLAVLVLSSAWLAWQTTFVPLLAVGILVTVLYVAWNREPIEPRWVPMDPVGTAGRILSTPTQRSLLLAYALFFFVVGGIVTFLPELLIELGIAGPLAAVFYSLLFVVGLVTKPVAGELIDRFPRLGVSVATLVASAAGLAGLLAFQSLTAVVLGTIVTAIGYKTQFPITDAVVLDAAPGGSMGTDLGAARAVFQASYALGPGVVGIVAGAATFTVAFWVLAGGLLVSAGILLGQSVRS